MSNAQQRHCGECNGLLPEGRAKFCSTKCATRHRVRRHRLKHNSEGTAHVKIRHSQLAKDIKKAQVAARTALREATTAKRQELKRLNSELTRELQRDIAASGAKIAEDYAIAIAGEFDSQTIALAIAARDARTTSTTN